MANTSGFKALQAANSRVFIIEGRARGDHNPSYESNLRMLAVSQGFGDIETIENPDPYKYGAFEEIGQIRGAKERVTTSLEGRYAIDLASTLLALARKGCAVDVQLHLGECEDPSSFNTFQKAIVLENAYQTSWNTEDLGVLQSGDNSAVNENADISAYEVYEILPMGFGEKAGSIVTNEIVDLVVCDTASCGGCEDESDGCYKIFGISVAAGGSPSTPPDIIYSIDKGDTWYAHDIESMTASDDGSGVDCLGSYLVVVSNDTNSLHYALKSEMDGITDPSWTEVTTGFVGAPNAISSIGSYAYIVGDSGYIYVTQDPTAGVTVLDAGSATPDNLLAVHALTEKFVVAVGNSGAIVYTANGSSFASAGTTPVGAGVHLQCVYVKSESEWWIGSNGGQLFYTLDGGDTWTEKAFPGSGSGVVHDIQFSTDSVAFLSHATSTPAGRILRSYDGGYSWSVMPESGTLPANDRVNALAVCAEDPNFVVGAGLGDNGSDGYVVVGSD